MWDGTRGAPTSPADHEPEFEEGKSLEKNNGLRKHESSVLIQMRTRKIGLRAFLHQRRVPEVLTPGCSCGDAPEMPEHLLLSCRRTAGKRRELPELRTRRDYEAQIDDLATAGSLARRTMDVTVRSAAPVRPSRVAAKRCQ